MRGFAVLLALAAAAGGVYLLMQQRKKQQVLIKAPSGSKAMTFAELDKFIETIK
jgi:hypothetical protein